MWSGSIANASWIGPRRRSPWGIGFFDVGWPRAMKRLIEKCRRPFMLSFGTHAVHGKRSALRVSASWCRSTRMDGGQACVEGGREHRCGTRRRSRRAGGGRALAVCAAVSTSWIHAGPGRPGVIAQPGRGMAAALMMGAAGRRLGTRLRATTEGLPRCRESKAITRRGSATSADASHQSQGGKARPAHTRSEHCERPSPTCGKGEESALASIKRALAEFRRGWPTAATANTADYAAGEAVLI